MSPQSVMLLLGLAIAASANTLPTLSGNATLWNDADEFGYRSILGFTVPGFNYGFFNSIEAKASSEESSLDLLSTVMSTGSTSSLMRKDPPFFTMAYFAAQAHYVPFPDGWSGDVGLYGSAFAQVFVELIEFNDKDFDLKFTKDVDEVVSAYPFSEARWSSMTQASSGELIIFNATTQDGVFSLRYVGSSVVGVTSDGVLVTPKSVKVDIQIQNYPYKGSDTLLALRSYVASATVEADASFRKVEGSTYSSGEGVNATYFSWQGSAEAVGKASPQAASVSASALVEASLDSLPLEVQLFLSANADASAHADEIIFTFGVVQPSYIYWDPSAGVGSVPEEHSISKGLAIGLGIVGGVIGIALIGVCVVYARKNKAGYQQV